MCFEHDFGRDKVEEREIGDEDDEGVEIEDEDVSIFV